MPATRPRFTYTVRTTFGVFPVEADYYQVNGPLSEGLIEFNINSPPVEDDCDDEDTTVVAINLKDFQCLEAKLNTGEGDVEIPRG